MAISEMVALVATWSRILCDWHFRRSNGNTSWACNIREFDSVHPRLDCFERVLCNGIGAFCEAALVSEELKTANITRALNCATTSQVGRSV